ncbi:MAG: hypothetical protein E7532_01190 [Ruminococcaceae bacterium]|nr:hypothetical protein [Oscillospiraceae bacterium]
MSKSLKEKSFFIVAAIVALILFAAVAASTTLYAAGKDNSSDTSALYTDDILSQAGITLDEKDEVHRVDADGAVSLTIIRAFDVEVVYRGESFMVKVAGGTVSEAINAAGFTLSGAESVSLPLDAEVKAGTVIEITADCVVVLTDSKVTTEVATKAITVAEFLKESGVKLNKDDIINVSEDTAIEDGLEIVINRVEYKEEIKTETVDYGFVTEETDDMYLGVTEIYSYGIEGEKEVTYKCKYVDGELVDSEVVSEKITREPVDQIELVGTYEEPEYDYDYDYDEPDYDFVPPTGEGAGTFIDHNGNEVSYINVYTGSATAYYAAEGSHTATGVPVYKGGVAVNPDLIPYGTKLYIVASDGSILYGYATAVDTGGALMSGEALVDVFYPTYDECVIWGRRDVTVYVLG